MEVGRAQEYKRKIEEEILAIIQKFEKETECFVDKVYLDSHLETGMHRKTYNCNIEVHL